MSTLGLRFAFSQLTFRYKLDFQRDDLVVVFVLILSPYDFLSANRTFRKTFTRIWGLVFAGDERFH